MSYTNIISTMKWWDPHKKRLKYCSPKNIYKLNTKFCKGLSPGSELMLGTNISNLPTLKIDLSDHPFLKDYIFEDNFNFHKEALPLALSHNTMNITTCYTFINQKITAHGTMHLKLDTGKMFGS